MNYSELIGITWNYEEECEEEEEEECEEEEEEEDARIASSLQ